ncbi:MAG: tRNA (guanine(10)-N(2))-dimethyltransferase [Thaumarchaeota archaeon]|nr:tRNA (guanine(10)-N(2))-dimethyltransferase [Nitrososphaerota archaeon]MDE1866729.1 tRNA (guanine(10)-N(2))-dimethyltransferase [Nitrososphaerota archaeon]
MQLESDLAEIVEGTTKLLVPKESLVEKAPPREPAFFNPRAKVSRDFSIIAYATFLKNFKGPKILLDSLSGIGARSIRAANELNIIEKVFINDVNPKALEIAENIAKLNNVTNCIFSENEACRFLSLHSKREQRGAIVDIDPFGSPSRYLDCGIRATFHGGLLSATATDLTVLHGLFPVACKRKYYGVPVRTEYGNEIALRLILGCISMVAGRLDVKIVPLFVQNNMHYYKTYVKVLVRTGDDEEIGYILHCKKCGNRHITKETSHECKVCNSKAELAGPLWIGNLYTKDFVNDMIVEENQFQVDKSCKKILEKCKAEIDMPPTYFTIDEIAHIKQSAPISLAKTIEKLQKSGFRASATSLNPAAFKTDARVDEILAII